MRKQTYSPPPFPPPSAMQSAELHYLCEVSLRVSAFV